MEDLIQTNLSVEMVSIFKPDIEIQTLADLPGLLSAKRAAAVVWN